MLTVQHKRVISHAPPGDHNCTPTMHPLRGSTQYCEAGSTGDLSADGGCCRVLDTGQWVRRSSTTGLPVDFMASVVMKKPSDPEELNRMTSGSNCYKDHHDPLMRTVPHYAKPGLLREALRTGSPPPPSTKRLSATSMGFYPTRASVPARVEALPSRSNNATPSMSYSVNVSEMALPVVPPLEVSGSR